MVMREVFDQLKVISSDIPIPEAKRFPHLQPTILTIVDRVLEDCLVPTQEFITDFIDVQIAYINATNSDCVSARDALAEAENDVDKLHPTIGMNDKDKLIGGWESEIERNYNDDERNEMIQIYTIKRLLSSYFDFTKKMVGDYVPKAVMSFLVIKSKEKLQNELISQLYKKEKFDELFLENADIPFKRQAMEELQNALSTASKILSEVRDFDVEH
jgi:hypothetical protein